ncbi:MAG: hypothetical protein R2942_15700 [Ignavibacteria bacterium]
MDYLPADQISVMKDKLFVDVSARVDGIYISNEQSLSPLYVIYRMVQ